MMNGNRIEVLSGLEPGQRVVIAGVHQLQENQKVTTDTGSSHE